MSLAATYPYYVANEPEAPNHDLEVLDKYSGEVATRVAMADDATIDRAIQCAVDATEPMAAMASYERKAILDHCVVRFRERFEELADALCIEAGKPIKDARRRSHASDRYLPASPRRSPCASGGKSCPSISVPRARGYSGMWKRVPIGVLLFHFALQFSVEPGRAQGRAGPGRRAVPSC